MHRLFSTEHKGGASMILGDAEGGIIFVAY
jgi:hypothetical protein